LSKISDLSSDLIYFKKSDQHKALEMGKRKERRMKNKEKLIGGLAQFTSH
jgi:hypothetical protein